MSAGESTPAPASVEQAARAAARAYADEHRSDRSAAGWGISNIDFYQGYIAGNAAAADRAALARLLERPPTYRDYSGTDEDTCAYCHEPLEGYEGRTKDEHAPGCPWAEAKAHLAAQQPARIQSTKASATEIRQAVGVTADEHEAGRDAMRSKP